MADQSADRLARWLPFAVMATVSLWVAAGFPHARKPFVVNVDLSAGTLVESMAKTAHYEATAIFFVLGVVAVGPRRASIPFWLAMGLGVAWELAEATAARHTARVADLLPDVIAAAACVIALSAGRRLLAGRTLRLRQGVNP